MTAKSRSSIVIVTNEERTIKGLELELNSTCLPTTRFAGSLQECWVGSEMPRFCPIAKISMTPVYFGFWVLVCYATIQLATQLQQRCIQACLALFYKTRWASRALLPYFQDTLQPKTYGKHGKEGHDAFKELVEKTRWWVEGGRGFLSFFLPFFSIFFLSSLSPCYWQPLRLDSLSIF